MSTTQEKLQLVFTEHFQVKRVKKQMDMIVQGRQKYYYDPKVSFIRGHSVTFFINFIKGAFKKFKKLQHLLNFQIKIILKKQYPAKSPLIFCMSENMLNFGLEPFRDYSEFLAVDWSAKFTVFDIIKIFPQFLDGWKGLQNDKKGLYRSNENFELQRIFSWPFLQTFPVKFTHPNNRVTSGLLVINSQSEIILLQQNQNRDSYLTKDLIKMNEMVSILKSRQDHFEILLQIKRKLSKTKQSLLFRSDDSQNIINFIIEYMKLTDSFGKERAFNQSQLSSEDEQQLQEEFISKQSPTKMNIEEIREEIVLYESLVESNMTSQNVSNLVILLRKAIEYYSALGKQDFQIYLKKLKTLMSNQMAQVLLESKEENDKNNNSEIQNKKNKVIYKSIIDMF